MDIAKYNLKHGTAAALLKLGYKKEAKAYKEAQAYYEKLRKEKSYEKFHQRPKQQQATLKKHNQAVDYGNEIVFNHILKQSN